MASILLLFTMIAASASTTMPEKNMMVAAQTNQSSDSDDAIGSAERLHQRIFRTYILLLLIAAFATWLVWWSGNRVQGAIRANADERITALKGDVAAQQERAANAERALLELQARLAHRRISPAQRDNLVATLRQFRGSVVDLTKIGELEASNFADDILAIFRDSGWDIKLTVTGIMVPPVYGLVCYINQDVPAGRALAGAFRDLPTASITPAPRQGIVADITVGLRPTP